MDDDGPGSELELAEQLLKVHGESAELRGMVRENAPTLHRMLQLEHSRRLLPLALVLAIAGTVVGWLGDGWLRAGGLAAVGVASSLFAVSVWRWYRVGQP